MSVERNSVDYKKMMVQAIEEYESSIAKIILLCIKNLEFGLGANKLAQILVGTQTKFITDYELQNNPAYSLLKQYSQKDVRSVIEALVDFGYLERVKVNFNIEVLDLTSKAILFLQGKESFDASFIDQLTQSDFVELNDEQTEVYEKLRELRYSLAKTNDIPAYTICNDKTLRLMAASLPCDEESILEIKGVGKAFVEKYGDQFISKIKELSGEKTVNSEAVSHKSEHYEYAATDDEIVF